MKTLYTIFMTLILTFAAPAYAESTVTEEPQEQTAQEVLHSNEVHVSVNGLVCDFCARALEKVFSREAAVKNIDVNLDTKIITVTFNEGETLSDEKLTQLITDAGYNVEAIHRVE